ncbi:MAG: penicillin-binding protein [Muribaculaceae bacterium]|nr:penicillin-binding protein [Muribaculaceae bacterium]
MKEKSEKLKKRNRRIIITLWSLFGAGLIAVILFFVLIYNGAIGYMPPVAELRNPADKYASVIYSADGEELGRYFRNTGNRVYTDFHEISPHVVDALISTEDARFEEHSGIDMRAFFRVFFKTLILGNKNAGGGSTITQQLAKQLYSPTSRGFLDRAFKKPVEWMISLKLERFYSKEEILKMYLNQFDFLYNAVGIQSAAQVYFNKEAKDLNLQEAAMLVGMVKNPAYYNPVRQPERTRDRRNIVLDQMVKAGRLSKAEADSVKQLPIELDFHRVDHKDGLAPYFREELRRMLTAHRPDRSKYMAWEGQKFVDDSIAWETNPLFGWIDKNPKPDGSRYDIYTDGLRIYTTIDSRMQRYAEEAVDEHMQDLQEKFFREKKGVAGAPYTTNRSELTQAQLEGLIKTAIKQTDRYRALKKAGASEAEIAESFATPVPMEVFSYAGPIDTVMSPRDSILYNKHFLRTGFMSMDPKTGHVKAYVGGPDFTHFQYDMVSTGRRQIGSTVKPFLYTLAMEEGFTPCDEMLNDQPVIIDEVGRPWAPRNSGSARVGEMVTLRWALTNSNNWISARVMSQLSPTSLVRTMHNFGITNHLDPVMALCLGPCDVSVKEMVGAYTAFANQGMRTDPLFVTAIADNNGNIISEFTPNHTEVISENAYWKILSILLNVVDEGTGNRLRRAPYNITAQMGGKTGTTNSNSDGWFMAFTPELVSGTWVGGEERYIHFNSMANGQGASMALPVYGKYIRKVYDDKTLPYSQSPRFEFPDIDLCAKSSYGVYTGDGGENEAEQSIEGVFD